MEIKIRGKEGLELQEFRKAISFISEEIISYSIVDHTIILEVSDNADYHQIREKVEMLMNKYVISKKTRKYFENNVFKTYYDLEQMSCIKKLADGMIELQRQAISLYRYFESVFKQMAYSLDENCEEKMYPVLLPISEYKKTGYLKNSPQYAMFCSSVHENIDVLESLNNNVDKQNVMEYIKAPEYALSPSACFHTFIDFKDKKLDDKKIVTFTQNVFRNEGRFNYNDFGRLRDYHVREVVFIGDQKYVEMKRQELMKLVAKFMKEINLCGNISVASDPFIMPKLQKYKKIQLLEDVKYEVHLNYGVQDEVSVASFNLHGTSFTYPFHISVCNVESTVTGCAGFGLERWVLAFLMQYGEFSLNWPVHVRNWMKKNTMRENDEKATINNQYPVWPEFNDKERRYVEEVFRSHKIGGIFSGSKNEIFENKFVEYNRSKYCLTTSNGTTALYMALKALGIGNGDEVIVPAMTYIATASAVSLCGAIPVFVDVDPETCNIDVHKLESVINEYTKVIIPVHLWGNVCEIKEIMHIARKYKLFVIEDCCQALGAQIDHQKVGTFGDIGVFSFAPTKNITCGEGGACITDNYMLYEKMCELRNHGRFTGGDYYHKRLGWNFRLSEFSAAILIAQLEKLEEQVQQKQEKYQFLLNLLEQYKIRWLKPLKILENSISCIFGPTFIYQSHELGGKTLKEVIQDMLKMGIPVSSRVRIAICDNPIYNDPDSIDYCENICSDVTFAKSLELLTFGQPIGYSILTGNDSIVRKFVQDLLLVK